MMDGGGLWPLPQTAMFRGLIIVIFYGTSAAIFGPMIALS
jgi:hypothetical protein